MVRPDPSVRNNIPFPLIAPTNEPPAPLLARC